MCVCVCACNRVVVRVQMFPFQGASTTELPEFKQDLASFLLTRGPHAFIGHSWKGCSKDYPVPAALNADYVKHPRNPNTLHHFDDICALFDRLTALFLRVCCCTVRFQGAPTGLCKETAPKSGIFTRDWTHATAKMDCNAYVGEITMKGTGKSAFD